MRHRQAFEALSADCAAILNVEQDIQDRDMASLLAVDLFELVNQRILHDLVRAVTQRTVPGTDVERAIRRRRHSHWYDRYQPEYAALEEAAAFIDALDRVDLTVPSFAEGIAQYPHTWYQLDQRCRKFVYHARQSGRTTLLGALLDQIGNLYTNAYLLQLNDRW